MLITHHADGEPLARVLVLDPTGLDVVGFQARPAGRPAASVLSVNAAQQRAAAEMAGQDPMAVGVHAWARLVGGVRQRLVLMCSRVPLSHWVGSRTDFAQLSLAERLEHLEAGQGVDAVYGTHLGLTATVATSDGVGVHVRRAGKLLADGLLDSAVGDTVLAAELDISGSWDATTSMHLAAKKFLGITIEDVAELRITHLAVRIGDAGLWVGGHFDLAIDAATLRKRTLAGSELGDPGRFFWTPPGAYPSRQGEWTAWGLTDMALREAHADLRVPEPWVA